MSFQIVLLLAPFLVLQHKGEWINLASQEVLEGEDLSAPTMHCVLWQQTSHVPAIHIFLHFVVSKSRIYDITSR
jgi:hypothetical protein